MVVPISPGWSPPALHFFGSGGNSQRKNPRCDSAPTRFPSHSRSLGSDSRRSRPAPPYPLANPLESAGTGISRNSQSLPLGWNRTCLLRASLRDSLLGQPCLEVEEKLLLVIGRSYPTQTPRLFPSGLQYHHPAKPLTLCAQINRITRTF